MKLYRSRSSFGLLFSASIIALFLLVQENKEEDDVTFVPLMKKVRPNVSYSLHFGTIVQIMTQPV